MKTITRTFLSVLIGALALVPIAASAAGSVTINSLTPGASATAKTMFTLNLQASGFVSPQYKVTDSFGGTTLSNSNLNAAGNFTWVPVVSDVGTHNLTFTVSDFDGNLATVQQTITVLPPPSISIQGISQNASVMPGSYLSFNVVANGFTNPTFTPSDSFGGSTINGQPVINSSGAFSWKPDASQNGEHTITIYASDSSGHSASASVTVRVGSGPTLSFPANLVTNVSPGQPMVFTMIPNGYSPTGFTLTDSFPGSTLTSSNINTTGAFAWSPQQSDIGSHTVTVYGQVGAYGAMASTSQVINVLGPNGYLPPPAAPATTNSTATGAVGVSDLQKQLALLQAQISGASNPQSSAGYTFTLALKAGSENDEVLELQKLLKSAGYLKVEPNGYYGPSTIAAVKKFQAAKGLSQLGTVGPGTRAALNAITGGTSVSGNAGSSSGTKYIFNHFMGLGDDDVTEVTELQKRLKALGFYTDAITGYFGAATEAAVKKYQTANGLAPSGYVASITRAALNK